MPKSESRIIPESKRPASHRDGLALLMADHKEVKDLFKAYKKLVDDGGDRAKRQVLAEHICGLLTVHATIEEEILYPAARQAIDDDALLDEAQVEHDSAKELIAQIEAMAPDETLYDAKVIVLGEYVDHHVKEEEDEMFPKVRKTDMDLKALAEKLTERKEVLLAEVGVAA